MTNGFGLAGSQLKSIFLYFFFFLQSSWSSMHLHLSTQGFFVVKSIVWMGLEVVKQVLGGSWGLASISDSYLLCTWACRFHFPPVSFSSWICLNYWNCQLLAPRACCLCHVEQKLILTHGPAAPPLLVTGANLAAAGRARSTSTNLYQAIWKTPETQTLPPQRLQGDF